MKYNDICEHCGHSMTAYIHHLNSQLIDALSKLCDKYYMTEKYYHPTDLDLTHVQINNFQKLQYFGLVDHSPDGWKPTEKGMGFVRGKCVVYDRVATFGREVLKNDHTAWSTERKKPKLVHIGNLKNYVWKPKLDYQMEKARDTITVF